MCDQYVNEKIEQTPNPASNLIEELVRTVGGGNGKESTHRTKLVLERSRKRETALGRDACDTYDSDNLAQRRKLASDAQGRETKVKDDDGAGEKK